MITDKRKELNEIMKFIGIEDFEWFSDEDLRLMQVTLNEYLSEIKSSITIRCMECKETINVKESDWDNGKIFTCNCGKERFEKVK